MARVGPLELIGCHLIDISKLLQALVLKGGEENTEEDAPEDRTVKLMEVVDSNPKKAKKYRVQLKDKTNLLPSIPE